MEEPLGQSGLGTLGRWCGDSTSAGCGLGTLCMLCSALVASRLQLQTEAPDTVPQL